MSVKQKIERLERRLGVSALDRPRARITGEELTAGYKRLFEQAEHDAAARTRLRRENQIFAKAAIRMGDLRFADELLRVCTGSIRPVRKQKLTARQCASDYINVRRRKAPAFPPSPGASSLYADTGRRN